MLTSGAKTIDSTWTPSRKITYKQREDVRSSPYPHAEACFPTIFTSVALTNAVVERVTAHSDCRIQHIDSHPYKLLVPKWEQHASYRAQEDADSPLSHRAVATGERYSCRPEKVSKHSLFLMVNRMHDMVCDGVFLKQTIPIDRANSRRAPSANALKNCEVCHPSLDHGQDGGSHVERTVGHNL